jgi:hypothetical protein
LGKDESEILKHMGVMTMTTNIKKQIFQFKITLTRIEPAIWRRIQVPAKYSFWDLHVAIQDSMGWLDSHLHSFSLRPKHKRESIQIGIPDEDWDEIPVLAGWQVPINDYLYDPGQSMQYLYDFGDHWMHDVLLVMSRILCHQERGIDSLLFVFVCEDRK